MASQVAKAVTKQPWYLAAMSKMSDMYINLAGYRKMGLKTDDLINEEDENVLKALSRLPPKEQYDRVYRIRRATQLSLQHKLLPKAEWIKPEEDTPYLSPILAQVQAEEKEKAALDTLAPVRKH